MRKLRVAVFGTGYWAQFQIAAWQAIGVEVAAVWNRTRERAHLTAGKFGIARVFDTPEEVFAGAAFDIADIIADVDAHEALVLLAAAHHKAVICQKPMAATPQSCDRMLGACQKAGVWYAVHENFRYQPPMARAARLLLEGVIGRPLRAQVQLRSPDRAIMAMQEALTRMDHMALRDMGPHIFDVARCLFGEAARIYTRPLSLYPDIGVVDTALSLLEMENGMLVSCDLVHEFAHQLFVEGEKGTLLLDREHVIHIMGDGGRQTIDTKGWSRPEYFPQDSWQVHGGHVFLAIPRCLEALRDRFLQGLPAETSGLDNRETMRLVFAAMRSMDEGRAVSLAEELL